MDDLDIKPVLEGLIFVSENPIRMETLVDVLSEWNREAIAAGLHAIQVEYEAASKGIELVEVAGGYQFRTKAACAEWINRLKKAKTVKLSQAALETLAIVAYRQPVIRPAIEEIRGVDCGGVLRTLLDKGLIKMTGRKDLPGRPIIYGTSKAFLEIFGLNSLSDLPTLKEIQPPPDVQQTSAPPSNTQEPTAEAVPAAEVVPEEQSPAIPVETTAPVQEAAGSPQDVGSDQGPVSSPQ